MTDFRGVAKALHIATYSGWYRFEQRNGQWAQTEKALTFWKMTALQIDPNDPRHIYLATEHSGLFVSADGGAAWQRANPNVPRLTTVSLLALPEPSLPAPCRPPSIAPRTAALGRSWKACAPARTAAVFHRAPSYGARTRLSPGPKTKRRADFLPPSKIGGMLVSDDEGRHWTPAVAGLDDPDVHQILPSSRTRGLVVAACGEGIYRSLDRGEH